MCDSSGTLELGWLLGLELGLVFGIEFRLGLVLMLEL